MPRHVIGLPLARCLVAVPIVSPVSICWLSPSAPVQLFLCANSPCNIHLFRQSRMARDSNSDSGNDYSFILSGNPSTPLYSLLSGENSPASATHHLQQTQTLFFSTQLSPETEPADFLATHAPIKRLRSDSPPPQSSKLARQRGQTLTAKARALQKLMPGDARMYTAPTLEEARKYVQFLQAQIRVLKSMPYVDHQMASRTHGADDKSVLGDHHLGMLNRQQLMEVMLNSAVAQKWLSSQGCCLFSLEQVTALKEQWEGKPVFNRTTTRV